MQRTWGVINHITQNQCFTSEYPGHFVNSSNNTISNLENIVDEFNNYFVNVRPTLANKITAPDDKKDLIDNLIDCNVSSMFLSGVD